MGASVCGEAWVHRLGLRVPGLSLGFCHLLQQDVRGLLCLWQGQGVGTRMGQRQRNWPAHTLRSSQSSTHSAVQSLTLYEV